jgi:hypothetical protein
MAQGGASDFLEIRPRDDTANWAAAVGVGWFVMFLATRETGYLFPAAMLGALWLQCRQRLVIDGTTVRRVGLHPVVLDLSTAEVVSTGRSWWVELFFLGRSLRLRDADGHCLYLESWLWDPVTRVALVEAAGRRGRS